MPTINPNDEDLDACRKRAIQTIERLGLAEPGLDAYKLADELLASVKLAVAERLARWQNTARDMSGTCELTLKRVQQMQPVVEAARRWASQNHKNAHLWPFERELLNAVNTYNRERSMDS